MTLEYQNFVELIMQVCTQNKNKPALCYGNNPNSLQSITYREVAQLVQQIGKGLLHLQVKLQDRIAILASTSPWWLISDFSIISVGAITTTIYDTCSPNEILDIINDSKAKFIFLDNEKQLTKVYQVYQQTNLEGIIIMNDNILKKDINSLHFHIPIYTLSDLKSFANSSDELDSLYKLCSSHIKPSTIASIVYTSGTSGKVKGAQISHKNILSALDKTTAQLPVSKDKDSFLAFLTTAHIFERISGEFYFFSQGGTIYYCPSLGHISSFLQNLPIRWILSVPLILTKIQSKIQLEIKNQSPPIQKLISWGLQLQSEQLNKKISLWGTIMLWILKQTISRKIRLKISSTLSKIVTGGAPLSDDVTIFFEFLGLPVLLGYGLTETTSAICVNTLKNYKLNTVGKAFPDTSIKISDDSEILIKGDNVFSGYWNNQTATNQVFDHEGFFLTGDLGSVDSEGYLTITGRKKDLIITQGGKKISPSKIEELIKQSPYIEQIAIFGDNQRWLIGLISVNENLIFQTFPELQDLHNWTGNLSLHDLINKEIHKYTCNLPNHEKIQRFKILEEPFSKEKDELTHTLKPKRHIILNNYKNIITQLFS